MVMSSLSDLQRCEEQGCGKHPANRGYGKHRCGKHYGNHGGITASNKHECIETGAMLTLTWAAARVRSPWLAAPKAHVGWRQHKHRLHRQQRRWQKALLALC
jgi:hypothetical protein